MSERQGDGTSANTDEALIREALSEVFYGDTDDPAFAALDRLVAERDRFRDELEEYGQLTYHDIRDAKRAASAAKARAELDALREIGERVSFHAEIYSHRETPSSQVVALIREIQTVLDNSALSELPDVASAATTTQEGVPE